MLAWGSKPASVGNEGPRCWPCSSREGAGLPSQTSCLPSSAPASSSTHPCRVPSDLWAQDHLNLGHISLELSFVSDFWEAKVMVIASMSVVTGKQASLRDLPSVHKCAAVCKVSEPCGQPCLRPSRAVAVCGCTHREMTQVFRHLWISEWWSQLCV